VSQEGSEEKTLPGAVIVIGAPGSRASALATALLGLENTEAWDGPDEEALSGSAGPEGGDRLTADDWGAAPERPAGDAVAVAGTPRLSLQVPYLQARVEKPRFIFCWRAAEEALFNALAGWRSGAFVTHPDLEGWEGDAWSFALVPGWAELAGKDLPEVVAEQWDRVTRTSIEDLATLPPEMWAATSWRQLRLDPAAELERLAKFVGLPARGVQAAAEGLKAEIAADEVPDETPDELREPLESVVGTAKRAQEWLAAPPKPKQQQARRASTDEPSPLRSVHTGSIPQVLDAIGSSLLISTYQAGKLIVARKDGPRLNTHFRAFDQPMGLALDKGRLAIGTRTAIHDYRNMPAAAPRVEPKDTHDACYILRGLHVTGDVRIHDVAWVGDEMWFVATGFSCLATLDDEHSFVPRWQPPFISKVAPGDRCHLNGMEVVDGQVRWATALGQTDEPGGWRANKASGGCLLDVAANEVVLEGLSMPHSPRWHEDRLWILESGHGRLSVVDTDAGTIETVAELPGFTRGLAFAGPFAFVGLSQIRETAIFGGLPLTERLEERQCGVWVVDTRSGGIAGFIRFEEAVQEVYDVLVLPGQRMPEIAEPGSELTRTSYVIKGWQG
jgi:uncharacterized protein (TIGR03032 family)